MRYLEQMEEFKDRLDAARADGSPSAEAYALHGIARIYIKEEEPAVAREYLAEAEAVCRQGGLLAQLGEILTDMGDLSLAENEWADVRKYYDEALEIFKAAHLLQGQARVHDRLAIGAHRAGETETALDHYRKGLDLCRVHGDGVGSLYFLDQMMPLLKERGSVKDVTEAYRELITTAEKIGDRERMALGLVGLADVYRRTDRPEDAEPHLMLAHDLYLRVGKEEEAELIRQELESRRP